MKRSSGTRKRGSAARKKGGTSLAPLVERIAHIFSPEVVGALLLVAGLFFSAAFLTGRGAFLGEAGFAALTHLLGPVGLALAPLAALAGVLLLLGNLPWLRTLGMALLLLAFATTLAGFLPENLRFDASVYPGRGGLLGSGLYSAIHTAGGTVAAVLALVFLYVVGVLLVTGVTLELLAQKADELARSLYSGLQGFLEKRRSGGDRPTSGHARPGCRVAPGTRGARPWRSWCQSGGTPRALRRTGRL
jgi:S-DNA-T family DNA segregation ATPase FtsK/SpoIIIE